MGVLGEDRVGNRYPADDHIGDFGFSLMFIRPAFFESADACQEFPNVVRPSPFAVTDDVNACLLLQPNCKRDHLVEHLLVSRSGDRFSLSEQVLNDLGPWQGTDDLRKEWRQPACASGFHRMFWLRSVKTA